MDLSEEPSSEAAAKAYQEVKRRMGLTIATINTDNGGENEKNFSLKLNQDNVIQFWSKTATPTDNPRVERSHLTDDKEFYSRQNIYPSFKEQKLALEEWERTYNFVRPHQALGYLTPMEFYQLWKENPEKAHQIVKKYRSYLRRQRERLAQSRKMKNKEQIEKLMEFIDAKLNKKVDLDVYKLDLIKCQLCS